VLLRIFRFEPGVDRTPSYDVVKCPRRPHMRVLDALNVAYEELDMAFAFRWYCGTKKCGECAISVNGVPTLACWEAVSDEMRCEPLTNCVVVRDLVVDRKRSEEALMRLRPWITRRHQPVFPETLAHSSMRATHRLAKCIECGVCDAVVPIDAVAEHGIGWQQHAGPMALVRFARFALDPRDETHRTPLAGFAGLASLPPVKSLQNICPQGINIIEDAIKPAQRRLSCEGPANALDDGESEVCFIQAPEWSAFVRLTANLLNALTAEGVLRRLNVGEIEGAYEFRPKQN
jgi:fumarate reductase (CoM/CoB) subunit B